MLFYFSGWLSLFPELCYRRRCYHILGLCDRDKECCQGQANMDYRDWLARIWSQLWCRRPVGRECKDVLERNCLQSILSI